MCIFQATEPFSNSLCKGVTKRERNEAHSEAIIFRKISDDILPIGQKCIALADQLQMIQESHNTTPYSSLLRALLLHSGLRKLEKVLVFCSCFTLYSE